MVNAQATKKVTINDLSKENQKIFKNFLKEPTCYKTTFEIKTIHPAAEWKKAFENEFSNRGLGKECNVAINKSDIKTMKGLNIYYVTLSRPKFESELWNELTKKMKNYNFSQEEINDVMNIIKSDITYGRISYLKNVIPELIDLAIPLRDLKIKEAKGKEGAKDGILLSLNMYAIAKYQSVEDVYKVTGHMEEIADNLFFDMGTMLKNLKEFDANVRKKAESYIKYLKEEREGGVSVPVDMTLQTPFMDLNQPIALNSIRSINFWSYFPRLDQSLPIKELFNIPSMISDVPIPQRPFTQYITTEGMIAAAISRVSDQYMEKPPEKVGKFTGWLSGSGYLTKIGEEEYNSGRIGLTAHSDEAAYITAQGSASELYGRLMNMRTKEPFNTWIHDLRVSGTISSETPKEFESVLNTSFLRENFVDGSGMYVYRNSPEERNVWCYTKLGDKYVYVGQKEIKKEDINNFFGAEIGEILLKGESEGHEEGTYIIASPIPFAPKTLATSAVIDKDTKREMYNLMVDPKLRKLLFLQNPKLMIESWILDKERYLGGTLLSGKPGEDYYRFHYLAGKKDQPDNKRSEFTFWDENKFVNGAYLKKLAEYQGILEGKYGRTDDTLAYLALDSTKYVETKTEKTENEWVGVLKGFGVKFQTSRSRNNLKLNKVSYTKGDCKFELEFGSVFGNNLHGVAVSLPLENGSVKIGHTKIEDIMFGGKSIWNSNDAAYNQGFGAFLAVAKWERGGVGELPGVNKISVEDLPEDSVAHTVLIGIDKKWGRGKSLFVIGEHGKVEAEEQKRDAVGVYFTSEALDVVQKKKKGVTLYTCVEKNTGTVFITTEEPNKETIYRLGLGYYVTKPEKTFRVDVGIEHIKTETLGDEYKYTMTANLYTPSGIFWVRGEVKPGFEEWGTYGGVSIKFNGEKIEKSLSYLTYPFYWSFKGVKWLVDQF